MRPGRDGGGSERTENGPHTVQSMQQTEHFTGIGQVANPRIPCRVLQPIAETCKDKADHENGVWWMKAIRYVGNEMADGTDDGDASLTERHVDLIVDNGC